MNLREEILKKNDLKRQKITIDEWGVDLYIREMDGDERYEISEKVSDNPTQKEIFDMSMDIVIWTCEDENGNRIFREEDKAELKKKSIGALRKLQEAAMEINGMGEIAVEENKKK